MGPAKGPSGGFTAPGGSDEPRTIRQRFLYYSQACDAWVFRRFRTLGKIIHDRQWRFLILPMLLMLPCIAGMTRMSEMTEDDPAKLYVPEDTQASRDQSKIYDNFGLTDVVVNVYGVADPEGDNMLTTSRMLQVYDAWGNFSSVNATYNGAEFGYEDRCVKLDGQCQKSTVLAFYDYNRTLIASLSDSELWQTLEDANFVATEQDGRMVNLSTVANYDADAKTVVSTKFSLVMDQVIDEDGDGKSEDIEAWELEFARTVNANGYEGVKFYSDTFAELGEENGKAFDYDLFLLPVGYILLLVYATVVLSRNSPVHSHGSLAWVSFLAAGVAIAACFGLGLWFGITFSNIIITLAFLLLGLGMDDTFVLVAAFQHPEVEHLPPRDRVAQAMARAGSSIAVTSLTDVVAFLAGSYTSIPVVKAFCQYAAIGVSLDFFLQITFFAAAMHLSATREEKDKFDWLCCVMSRDPDAQCVPRKKKFDQDKPEMMTIFLGEVYGPRLLTPIGKAIGITAGVALLVLNVWACTQVTVDFEYEWFIPDDSYIQDMFAVREKYWGSRNVPSGIYTFQGDYSSNVTQVQLSQMTTALDGNEYLVPGSCVIWWPAFIEFAESNATAAMQTVDGERIVASSAFDDTLYNFYSDDAGGRYTGLLFLSSSNVLELSRITCLDDADESGMPYRTDQMDRLRDIASIASSVGAVAFGPGYWVQDAHKIFLQEIVINLAFALAGVFLITTVMLGSLLPSLLVTFLLVCIDVEVLGSIYLSGDYFNTVTGINLVLAVGLSVDAVAHITHAFLACDGTGNERADKALTEIGRSVSNGAISTMVVLLPLSGAKTYVFQVFFRTFMAIIGYSAFNGLVVLPVLLSVIQPTSYDTIRHELGLHKNKRSDHHEKMEASIQLTELQADVGISPPGSPVVMSPMAHPITSL